MKVTIEVDCTPEEARRFMGLPDVTPLHEEMIKHMSDSMAASLPSMDPTKIAEMWMPLNTQMMEQAQKAMRTMAGQGSKTKKD